MRIDMMESPLISDGCLQRRHNGANDMKPCNEVGIAKGDGSITASLSVSGVSVSMDGRDYNTTTTAMTATTRKSNTSRTSSNTTRSSCFFAEGRDFYDDCYHTSGDEDSVDDQLDLKSSLRIQRHEEIRTLHQVYKSVVRQDQQNIVFINGISGTGKSTLVEKFMKEVLEVGASPKPYYISGKYEELSGSHTPFSAIVKAFNGFIQSLNGKDNKDATNQEVQRIQQIIQECFGLEEIKVLYRLIPNLRQIIKVLLEVDEMDDNSSQFSSLTGNGTTSDTNDHAWNQLRYLFQTFANAISTKDHPVIMFLDDLQWMDQASLGLVQSLLLDPELQYFMFIGAYREDEVKEGLQNLLQSVSGGGSSSSGKSSSSLVSSQRIVQIQLTNLNLDELKSVITNVLQMDNTNQEDLNRTQSLTNIIYNKTDGNIFYTIQLLEELQQKNILYFSRMTFEWEWNINDETINDLISDSLLEAVLSKIQSLPELLQKALTLAAYTRSTICSDTMQQLFQLQYGYDMDTKKLVQLLDKAVMAGLLTNAVGSKNYSFAHDRIQQAAYTMIPAGMERDTYRNSIGYNLYKMGSSDSEGDDGVVAGEDWMLFVGVEHLNATSYSIQQQQRQDQDPLFLTKINLEVGTIAASLVAYETASKFLSFARQSLLKQTSLTNTNPWDEDHYYDITLQIYESITIVELRQGNHTLGYSTGEHVLKHAKSVKDRLPTQLAIIKALGSAEKHKESCTMGMKVLQELQQYPQTSLGVKLGLVRDLVYVKRTLRHSTDEEILTLPYNDDEDLRTVVDLYCIAAYQAYHDQNKIAFLAMLLRGLRIMFTHGMCANSGVAMMGYCMYLSSRNDMTGVERCSKLALQLLQKTNAKKQECFQLFMVAYFIKVWKDPHSEVLELFQCAYKSGMETGDFEKALACLAASHQHELVAGISLDEVNDHYVTLMEKSTLYNVKYVQTIAEQQWLVVQYLRDDVVTTATSSMGSGSGSGSTSSNSSMDLDQLENFYSNPSEESGMIKYQILYGCLVRLQLGVYFSDYTLAHTFIHRVTPFANLTSTHAPTVLRLFFGSLTYSYLARKGNDRQPYRNKSKCLLHELKQLCEIRGKNSWHRYLLALAQYKSSSKRSRKTTSSVVLSMYEEAINAARNSGHDHDSALGHQLTAEYVLCLSSTSGDDLVNDRSSRDDLIGHHLRMARDLYRIWGATGLVKHLEEMYNQYFPPSLGG